MKIELLNTRDAVVLWRQSFTGSVNSPHELQSAIAGQIFNYFGQQYSPYNYNRPKSAEAYKAHLRRAALAQTSDTEELLKWAELTTSLEPDFALGYVNTVFPYLYMAVSDTNGPWPTKIRAALDKAAELGISESAEFKAHEGLYQWVIKGDLDAAEPLLRDAFVNEDPFGRIFYARLLASSGLNKEVMHLLERLTVTEPYNHVYWSMLAERQAYFGDFRSAIDSMRRMIELTPNNYFDLELQVAMYGLAGQKQLAHLAMSRLREMVDYPTFRLEVTEIHLNYALGNNEALLSSAQYLADSNRHWPAARAYLLAGDPRVEEQFVLSQSTPNWIKLYLDGWEWKIPIELRNTQIWDDHRSSLGYTDTWRLELCERVAQVPPRLGLQCNPQEYAIHSALMP